MLFVPHILSADRNDAFFTKMTLSALDRRVKRADPGYFRSLLRLLNLLQIFTPRRPLFYAGFEQIAFTKLRTFYTKLRTF